MEFDFDVTILDPICDDLILVDPDEPSDMEIKFASIEEKTQPLPNVVDTFGLIGFGYCTVSLILVAEKEDYTNNEFETFLTMDTALVLITPTEPVYIGAWSA